MKKIGISLFVLFIGGVFLTGCYNNNVETLYPDLTNSCDTTSVTYSKTISKIVSNNCLSCHGSTYDKTGSGIRLDNYADFSSKADIVIEAVKHTSGYAQMPKNANKLSDCNIKQIEIWINQGKTNN
jgi:mono/diheme cytochrome c family protein